MFTETKDRNGRMIICALRGNEAQFAYTQEDWSEPLLCAICEAHINTRFEQRLKAQLYLRRKGHNSTTEKRKTIIRTDSNVFALSLLSIFWRCAIAKRWAFRKAALPEYIANELRRWIKEGKIAKNWGDLLTIKLQEIVNHEGKRMPFLAPVMTDENADQTFSFKLIFGGYKLTITLPPPPDHLHTTAKTIRPNWNKISIEHILYRDVPEIMQILPAMIEHGKKYPNGPSITLKDSGPNGWHGNFSPQKSDKSTKTI